jgi:hypothetical protein
VRTSIRPPSLLVLPEGQVQVQWVMVLDLAYVECVRVSAKYAFWIVGDTEVG